MATFPAGSVHLFSAVEVLKLQKQRNPDRFNANASDILDQWKKSARLSYTIVLSNEDLYRQAVKKGIIKDEDKELCKL